MRMVSEKAGAPGPVRWPQSSVVRSLAEDNTRLLLRNGAHHRETRLEYEARGGYQVALTPEELLESVDVRQLVGRGGAAFPFATKLRAVRDQPGPRYLVANGEEGEPLSVKDRWLVRIRPHLVIDGMLRAAQIINADKVYIYVSDAAAAQSAREALSELDEVPIPVVVVEVAPSYVAGEETAVVRFINGGPALPVDKPPRPYEVGVGGRPTLVSNVETLANLPFMDAADAATDTLLLTLSGACRSPGLYEVEMGIRLGEVLARAGDVIGWVRGALMGGYFAGIVGRRVLDLPLSYLSLRAEGSGLGCGAIYLIGSDECPVQVASDVMHYFQANNARQCGPCLRGTGAMSAALDRLASSTTAADDLDRLAGWSVSLLRRGACGYLDGAANLPATLVREFPDHVLDHRNGTCDLIRLDRPDRLQRLKVTVG
jgi:NADH:ubiquinone oxidoreductase subunit F (NADH-binding)